ncbi:hypothetical protein [Methylomonas rapida]|uniref:Uncharacterized protein n=1 Tax=Methylomonas rapida TaxID=2963939 RepID=A0ABY7GGX3_9GAMM|nr:hypothetical protein [Methylomonas rapida]WAR44510.1 hypothetical protein NM686_019500 [Methylomonas rapida]
MVIANRFPDKTDYKTQGELLSMFDDPASVKELKEMLTDYDPKKEGILLLITDYANATFFVTLKVAKCEGAVACWTGVGGKDAAVEPTWMYSRRPVRQATLP